MADLKTHFMGLSLKNPIIVGSCNLVNDPDNLKKIEDAGGSAIVYKSLFEEQIQMERFQLQEGLDMYDERNAEMAKIFPTLQHAGPEEHLMKLRKAVEAVNIPIIASLNAVYEISWVEYAQVLAQTGVAALELNFYSTPNNFDKSAKSIEEARLSVYKEVRKAVNIPVSIKLSPFYTNTLNIVRQLDAAGAEGFVLFNRLFQPDINIDEQKHTVPWYLSEAGDYRLPLRYAGILYGNIQGSLCANTGIHNGDDAVKLLLSGADCVQVVSTLYRNKVSHISTMLRDIETWMDKNGYKSIEDFKGKLSAKLLNDPFVYERAQYVDAILHSADIMKRSNLR